jgi:hypothetical protein
MENVKITDLRPTQFVLGMKEVQFKVKKFSGFSKSRLTEYLESHPIPIVVGPKKQKFLIDHHHLARACWETETFDFVLKVVEDLSALDECQFWNQMIKNAWTHLDDQFGLGPHSPLSLPSDVRGMADDPFRSLAWAVREEGGFAKDSAPFFEFKWAAFFRRNLKVALYSNSDFKDAIADGMKLAASAEAAHLPGYKKY